MTPLRQQLIDAMRQRGYSVRTHAAYTHAVSELACYYRRSPDQLSVTEVKAFFRHLALERQLSGASCRQYLHGVRFFYLNVLKWSSFDVPIIVPKQPQRIPELLTREEVSRIISASENPKHRMLLLVCYGCGLRVSELVALRVRDIDGERCQLRIEQGKGGNDRMVPMPPSLLMALRRYWSVYRPPQWLFSAKGCQVPVDSQTAQRAFGQAKRRAGVEKIGGIHSLRHAYATHQLAAGMTLVQLQHALGHHSLRSTERYLHWTTAGSGQGGAADLVDALVVSS